MGNSDRTLVPWYQQHIRPQGKTALLGFTNEKMFTGDCYDKEKGNWSINGVWEMPHCYDTIVCLRTAYFSSEPEEFIARCSAALTHGGRIYVDWGYGEHWRFPGFHVGWKYDSTHQYAYGENNNLWSAIWDDAFAADPYVQAFARHIKGHGYNSLKSAVYKEVPKVLELSFVKRYFNVEWHSLCLVKPYLQLYVLLCGVKK